MPEVIGQTLYNARIRISVNELNVTEPVQEIYSDNYPAGVVVDQDLPRQEKSLPWGQVCFYLSVKVQPADQQVPSLVGLTIEDAGGELEKLNLLLDSNTGQATSMEYFAGQIISRIPLPGLRCGKVLQYR
ncbi:MAG: PASTA domain-containing protein [Candidatus Syntrophopropionicum ammoniitolerans]